MTAIDHATSSDLDQILQWLQSDRSGFYGNRKLLKVALDESQLLVCREGDDVPAFLAFGICPDGILAVRKGAQGRGLGGKLARYGIEQEMKAGKCILDIECSPTDSIPFWEHLGFTIYPESNEGYKLINKTLEIPTKCLRAAVTIELYNSHHFFTGRDPFCRLRPICAKSGSSVYFSERTILSPRPMIDTDVCARIWVADSLLLSGKLKHEEAKACGIKQDPRGNFYVDSLVTD